MRFAAAALLVSLVPLSGFGDTPDSNGTTAPAAAPATTPSGQDLFGQRCGDCHTIDLPSYAAPALRGVFGRKIASLTDFQYSDALKAKSGGVWDEAALNAFLADPQSFAKGTAMEGSAPDPTERQAIIDYLKTVQ